MTTNGKTRETAEPLPVLREYLVTIRDQVVSRRAAFGLTTQHVIDDVLATFAPTEGDDDDRCYEVAIWHREQLQAVILRNPDGTGFVRQFRSDPTETSEGHAERWSGLTFPERALMWMAEGMDQDEVKRRLLAMAEKGGADVKVMTETED